jgi:hypothetical protein
MREGVRTKYKREGKGWKQTFVDGKQTQGGPFEAAPVERPDDIETWCTTRFLAAGVANMFSGASE